MSQKILVLDGRSRATITIVRSLGIQGYSVHVGDEYKAFSTFSKYCTKSIIYPSANNTPSDFKNFIKKLVEEEDYCAIIPVRDDTTKCLIELTNDSVIKGKVRLPKYSNYMVAFDKSNTIRKCRELKIPHPITILTDDFDNNIFEIIATVKNDLSLPFIVKPSISSGSRGIIIIEKWETFEEKLGAFLKVYDSGLVQEFIPYGGSYGVEFLYHNGSKKAQFTHKRLREYPVNGGPSTYRKADKYEEIESYSQILLDSLSWNGVAMVEFRIDSRNGKAKLMEINPRFWGSLAMAYYAGVDFPKLLVDLILSNDCEIVLDYNLNMKTRWLLFGDLLWFISAKKSKKEISSFFHFKEDNLKYDIISKDDPMPILGIFVDFFKIIVNKKKVKHIFKRGW